jgi:GrpB-like predicted nucleotidyltransferase (UPF0157 family)
MTEIGLESGRVRVVPYDGAWPTLYASEIARLAPPLAAAGVLVVFEHTGSTAVRGLAAKPSIDILAGLAAEDGRDTVCAALCAAGYLHRGEQGIPGRDFFRRGDPRQYPLHLALVDSQFWQDHRLFREWLRAHGDTAAEYAALKYALAARFPTDREAYITGKTEFVASVLRAAQGRRDAQ